jgi:hypothetical protein
MKKIYYYFFNYQNEWYFTEGRPTDKSCMEIFFVDADKVIRGDLDRYQYIRGWNNLELETMFLLLDNDCIIT